MEPATEQDNSSQGTEISPPADDSAVNPSVPSTPPESQPAQSSTPTENIAVPPAHNPGMIVLQWLTYAFWGWTILAMSFLTASILANFIGDADTGSFTPYAIAAVLVLLPISIVCDFFYSKHEPQKKSGAASIVMVIHAVLFALFGIGALIGIVFSLVTMFTSSSDSANTKVSLFSAMIITVLYGAVFLRTINPPRLHFVRRFYILFMTLVVGVISVLGIVGPVARERSTRNDRLIESGLSSVEIAVSGYARKNGKLPDTLASLDLTGDGKQLVSKGLVQYKPNTLPPSNPPNNYSSRALRNTTPIYYYQLCVTYARESKNKYRSSYLDKADSDGYQTSLYTYEGHDAGEKCYKLKTDDYTY